MRVSKLLDTLNGYREGGTQIGYINYGSFYPKFVTIKKSS